jgi:hypothetical protein
MKNSFKDRGMIPLRDEEERELLMRANLRLIRYIIAGALFGIYCVGFFATMLGIDTPQSIDYAAAISGGGTVALLAKLHVISI